MDRVIQMCLKGSESSLSRHPGRKQLHFAVASFETLQELLLVKSRPSNILEPSCKGSSILFRMIKPAADCNGILTRWIEAATGISQEGALPGRKVLMK